MEESMKWVEQGVGHMNGRRQCWLDKVLKSNIFGGSIIYGDSAGRSVRESGLIDSCSVDERRSREGYMFDSTPSCGALDIESDTSTRRKGLRHGASLL